MAKRDMSREELFAMVWERPTSEIAIELGISDVAVGKLCQKLQVPKPSRGYWARVEAGQTPRATRVESVSGGTGSETKKRAASPHRRTFYGASSEIRKSRPRRSSKSWRRTSGQHLPPKAYLRPRSGCSRASAALDPGSGTKMGRKRSGRGYLGNVRPGKRR